MGATLPAHYADIKENSVFYDPKRAAMLTGLVTELKDQVLAKSMIQKAVRIIDKENNYALSGEKKKRGSFAVPLGKPFATFGRRP